MRKKYIEKIKGLSLDSVLLISIDYDANDGNPPFSVTESEISERYLRDFALEVKAKNLMTAERAPKRLVQRGISNVQEAVYFLKRKK